MPAAEIEMAVVSPLLLWPREHRFAEYTAALDELGVEALDDLVDVTVGDSTAEAVGMKPIQARRFVRLATERLGNDGCKLRGRLIKIEPTLTIQ